MINRSKKEELVQLSQLIASNIDCLITYTSSGTFTEVQKIANRINELRSIRNSIRTTLETEDAERRILDN